MNKPIRISKNTPMPTNMGRTGGRAPIFPWAKMNHGDSIHIIGETAIHTARSSAYYYRSRNPEYRIVTRKEGRGVRMWKIEVEKPLKNSLPA